MIAFNKTKNRGWITLCFAVPIYSSSHSFFILMNWSNLGRANSDFPRIEVFKNLLGTVFSCIWIGIPY